MKNTIFNLAIAVMLMTTAPLFTGCNSASDDVETAKVDVKDAKEDLKLAQQKAKEEERKKIEAEEWRVFKIDADAKIKANEERIAELKNKMKTSGKTMDSLYAKRIDALEQENRELKNRLLAYENSQSDWQNFKNEFNKDMEQLGTALTNFTTDNK